MGLCTKGAKKRYGVIDRTSATVWRFVHRRLSKVIYLLHTFHYLGCIANRQKLNYDNAPKVVDRRSKKDGPQVQRS